MVERRGLGAALQLNDQKVAFIKKGASPATPASGSPTNPPSDSVAIKSASAPIIENTPGDEPQELPNHHRPADTSQPKSRRMPPRQPLSSELYEQMLAPLTTRLKATTAEALRRACLERKLARKVPNAQQDIVETALTAWLREHGFLG